MLIFIGLRVHWWYLWDYPSRRSVVERVLGSIVYTTLYPLGWALGAARLIGIGVQTPPTEFVRTDFGRVLETILRSPELDAHADRLSAVRSAQGGIEPGRTASAGKDAVSGSI